MELSCLLTTSRSAALKLFDGGKYNTLKAYPEYMDQIVIGTFHDEIEQELQNSLEREVSTDKIGEMVMERIKPLDEVAYIRFASVYRRFQNVNEFVREIHSFLEEK